jgi:hypothetical protein
MVVDRMAVLSAMLDQGVILVFNHPDAEVCKKVMRMRFSVHIGSTNTFAGQQIILE